MNTRLLPLDYQALAEHLHLRANGSDTPPGTHSFKRMQTLLKATVNQIVDMLEEPLTDIEIQDEELFDLLLANLGDDVIESLAVSESPGVALRVQGRTELMPLIYITVSSSR